MTFKNEIKPLKPTQNKCILIKWIINVINENTVNTLKELQNIVSLMLFLLLTGLID